MEGALRERRVRAHRLDLVPEQLDAERLAAGRREDIDDPAANSELPALLCALDPFVAGERELLRQIVLGVLGQADRLWPLVRRGEPFRDGGSGSGDQAAGGEDVERAGPLADQVRRRVEAGAPADAAAGEQRDAVVAEEPGGGFCGVARLGVLWQDDDEAAIEPEVECREEKRQRRLGHSGARAFAVGGLDGETLVRLRDLVRERLEALAVGELLRDDM